MFWLHKYNFENRMLCIIYSLKIWHWNEKKKGGLICATYNKILPFLPSWSLSNPSGRRTPFLISSSLVERMEIFLSRAKVRHEEKTHLEHKISILILTAMPKYYERNQPSKTFLQQATLSSMHLFLIMQLLTFWQRG